MEPGLWGWLDLGGDLAPAELASLYTGESQGTVG